MNKEKKPNGIRVTNVLINAIILGSLIVALTSGMRVI
jgi:hypothetical protein